MSNLAGLKKRIKSTKSVKKTTKTMELISAVYLRKFQAKQREIKKFMQKYQFMTDIFVGEANDNFLTENKKLQKYLIVFSASRGLNGNFDALIRREVFRYIDSQKQSNIKIIDIDENILNNFNSIVCFGKKGINWVRDLKSDNFENYIVQKNEKELLKNLSMILKNKYFNEEIGQIDVISMKLVGGRFFAQTESLFKSKQVLEVENDLNVADSDLSENFKISFDYDFMLEYLTENFIYGKLYSAYFESLCAENLARTFAMKQASNSATEIIDGLTLKYNQARQAKITAEVSEIISGMKKPNKKSNDLDNIDQKIIVKI